MKKLLCIILFLSIPSCCFAAITFDANGKWETTFECADWVWPDSGECDDLTLTGAGEGGVMVNKTSITADANYSLGKGGKGVRYWVNDGDDVLSAGIYANLSPAEKTLWVRFYFRFESGFKWLNNDPSYCKFFYIRSYPSGDPSAILGYGGNDSINIANQGGSPTNIFPRAENKGWSYVYPTKISDTTWHVYELCIKMNTTNGSQDGEGRIWVNGELVAEQLNVNWNGSNTDALQGFSQALFRSNQYWPDNGKEMYIDYDDIVIYNTTPPNIDAHGNPYIGPLETTPAVVTSSGGQFVGGTIK